MHPVQLGLDWWCDGKPDINIFLVNVAVGRARAGAPLVLLIYIVYVALVFYNS